MSKKPQEIIDLENYYDIELFEEAGSLKIQNNSYKRDTKGNIVKLNLANNKLKNIPDLRAFTKLVELDLSNNSISKIENLENCQALKYLYLGKNNIKIIEGLDSLNKLKFLILEFNTISKIDGLLNMNSLIQLDLAFNNIYKIEGLNKLYKIKELWLLGNKIKRIENLENLTNLENLILGRNFISNIEGLTNLTKLRLLYLDQNMINSLNGINQLTNIHYFDLSENKITNIEALETLVDKYEFTFSSESSEFKEIKLKDNPLDEVIINILRNDDLEQKSQQLSDYFANLKKGEKPLLEAKLMLLGEGESGKTNFRNCILQQDFEKNTSATTGIQIDAWKPTINRFDYRINIWDFGGQWIQQQVHQFFLTSESIYVLLLNARQEDAKPEKWLDWIKNYTKDAKVFVVANKMDENPNFKINENALKEEFPFIVGFAYISLLSACSDTNEKVKIDHLIQDIQQQVTQLRNINNPVPANYHALKNDLEDNYLNENHSLNFDGFEENLFRKHELIGNPEPLLDLLQNIGTVRFFEKFDKVILSPEWLSGGVYKILMSPLANSKLGVLTDSEIESIVLFESNEHKYKKSDIPFLKQLMQDFKLAHFKNDLCFIPTQFRQDFPNNFTVEETRRIANFEFYFEFDTYFPELLISRFIVDFFNKKVNDSYWKTGIVLQDEDKDISINTKATIVSNAKERRIFVFMEGKEIRPFFKEIYNNVIQYLQETGYKYSEFIFRPKENVRINYKNLLVHLKENRKLYTVTNNDKIIDFNVKDTLGLINNDKEIETLRKALEEEKLRKANIINNHTTNIFEAERHTNISNNINNIYNQQTISDQVDNLKILKELIEQHKEMSIQLEHIMDGQLDIQSWLAEGFKDMEDLQNATTAKSHKQASSKLKKWYEKILSTGKTLNDWKNISNLPDYFSEKLEQIDTFMNTFLTQR